MTHIFLVPGFMGFQSFGELTYFRRVPEMLARRLRELGHEDVQVHECPTIPSGSIARRAQRALQFIADRGGAQAESIHIVGHSTGGLDARLVAAPGVRLLPGGIEEEVGRRIHSVITVSTPHYGAPLSKVLMAMPFRRALETIGFMGRNPRGRVALLALARVMEMVARADDWMGRTDTFLDVVVNRVLKRIGKTSDDPVWEFLHELSSDQGATIQLTMEAMHLFNAAVADRPGTQYSSLITVAPTPPGSFRRADFLSPVKAASALVFWVLYRIAASVSKQYPYTALDIEALKLSEHSAPVSITIASNDGIVPCQSQAYGKVLDIVLGDHLDVVGQFPGSGGDAHADWLPCGANFGEEQFCRAWSRVAEEISRNTPATRRPARMPASLPAPIVSVARASKAVSAKNGKAKPKLVPVAS
ncbi:esterase/lipase family protein [Sorangium sp. So ce693]|uniref:esterase/lipase family protein n=1 Tax=Sorangium sp. So ce693 TaxID=3133318 RepID=UPI003F5FB127